MGFDGFVQDAREQIARHITLISPELVETYLCRPLQAADVEPVQVVLEREGWAMLAFTALPDGRIARAEYSAKTGEWRITTWRREAPQP